MGFAVVADEVRNLAQRSAQAAKETTELIDGSVRTTRTAFSHVENIVKTMRDVAPDAANTRAMAHIGPLFSRSGPLTKSGSREPVDSKQARDGRRHACSSAEHDA
jgi:hypothetical protein